MNKTYQKLIKRSVWPQNYNDEKILQKFIRFPLCTIKGKWKTPKILLKYDSDKESSGNTSKQLYENNTSWSDTFFCGHIHKDKQKDLQKITDVFGLEKTHVNLHIQQPGQQMVIHIDSGSSSRYKELSQKELKEKIIRLFVFLEDWKPGQVVLMGASHIVRWKKGQVLWFDWYNVPHGTANFGHYPRAMLCVTGLKTKKFEKLFQKKENQIINI